MKKHILILLVTLFFIFFGCSVKYSAETQIFEESNVIGTIILPTYKVFPEISDLVKKTILEDFDFYKSNLYKNSDFKFSYRTEFIDKSNGKFINAIEKKFVSNGKNIEDEYYFTWCMNRKTRKIETVSSITGKTLDEISELCFDKLISVIPGLSDIQKYEVGDRIRRYITPEEKSFCNFYADKKNVYIYFPAGSALPEYVGTQIVTIKY